MAKEVGEGKEPMNIQLDSFPATAGETAHHCVAGSSLLAPELFVAKGNNEIALTNGLITRVWRLESERRDGGVRQLMTGEIHLCAASSRKRL